MARVIIVGGHGKIALLVEPMLIADGHEVTALIRNPAHAEEVAATGATPVVADVEGLDTAALAEILGGYDVVLWSAGAGGGNPARTYAVDRDAAIRSMDAAEAAKVDHYLMVSYFGASLQHGVAEDDPFFAYAEAKAAADEHLRRSSLRWTILMPSTLSNEPAGGVDITPDEKGRVSRATVAAVIRAILATDPARLAQRNIPFNDGNLGAHEAVTALTQPD